MRLIKGQVGPRHDYREKHRNPTKCVAFEIKEDTGNIAEYRRKNTHFKSFFFSVTILLFSARSGGGGLTTPLHLLFLFTALQERCTLALDINLFLLRVGSIFVELQETDSDLDGDLDRLDPDTEHQELRQPVEWLQASCTSGAKYNADVRSTEREGKIEYPMCSDSFELTKPSC